MKKILQHITHLSLEIGLLLAFILGSVVVVYGQTTIYTQNFGTGSSFPAGWTTSGSVNWTISINSASSGYSGASGGSNALHTNSSGAGTLTFSNNLSTVGYSDITVLWGANRTGSNTTTFQYSIDGTNWTSISFTEATNNSTWMLVNSGTRISLPVNASGVSNLRFRWTFTSTSSRYIRLDDFSVQGCAFSTPPTSITGTSGICPGGSTLLTTSGGSLGTDAKDVWYEGACATEAYTNEWATQPFATTNTTINSVTGGILNVTSVNSDPMIEMATLGSFDPNIFRYIQIYYQVASGNGSAAEIFFYNTNHNSAVGGEEVAGALISDGAWHFLNFDMWSDPDYKTGGNITGWRFDWAGESGVTMNIDFITLANQPLIGLGPSVTVSPTTPATYFTRKKGGCNSTVCVSRLVTINADATLTLTSGNASLIVCKNNAITDIVFTIGGAGTSASVTSGSLPTGVTGTYNSVAKTFTISGIPTINATFPFTVTTSGSSCINPALSGTITVNALPAFTKSFTDITCFDAGNGIITISATGGSGTGYEYSINGGSNWQTGGNYTGLGPATYTIKVKDSNGCIQTICQ